MDSDSLRAIPLLLALPMISGAKLREDPAERARHRCDTTDQTECLNVQKASVALGLRQRVRILAEPEKRPQKLEGEVRLVA